MFYKVEFDPAVFSWIDWESVSVYEDVLLTDSTLEFLVDYVCGMGYVWDSVSTIWKVAA
jgi:hypothetical protein